MNLNEFPQEYRDYPCFGFFEKTSCFKNKKPCVLHKECITYQIYHKLKVHLISKELDKTSDETRELIFGYPTPKKKIVIPTYELDLYALKDYKFILPTGGFTFRINNRSHRFMNPEIELIINHFHGIVHRVPNYPNFIYDPTLLSDLEGSTLLVNSLISFEEQEFLQKISGRIQHTTDFIQTLCLLSGAPSEEYLLSYMKITTSQDRKTRIKLPFWN